EAGAGVATATVGREQHRDRVPTVRAELAGSAVIAGDDEHVGIEGRDPRDGRVELFDFVDLGGEVAVFAGRVGVFEVYEEKIEILPGLLESGALIVQRLPSVEHLHAHQPRQAAVHRIHGDRRCAQAVDLFEGGDVRLLVDPAHGEEIGGTVVLQ